MQRLLVASDSDALRAALRSVLDSRDREIFEATDAAGVMDIVRHHQPYVVILDLQIGNMGAPAIARSLRSEAESGRLPATRIVCLLDRADDAFQARRADADAWLVKPVSPRQLRKTFEILLDPRRVWTPKDAGVLTADELATDVKESTSEAMQATPVE